MALTKTMRRSVVAEELNITSMMDMMTIILVFLLKSYQTDDISVTPSDDLMIPVSSSLKPPKLAVNVIVSRKDIVVDGEWVLDLEPKADPVTGQEILAVPDDEKRGQLISSLYDVLLEKAETAKDLGARTGGAFDFRGEILLQCDRRLPFSVIREVMFTSGQAQFGNFRFIVIQSG
jgi:biopolymer transport protein ExbD